MTETSYMQKGQLFHMKVWKFRSALFLSHRIPIQQIIFLGIKKYENVNLTFDGHVGVGRTQKVAYNTMELPKYQ